MILLSILGFGILVLAITLGTSFSMVLFVQNQVQHMADEVALTGALQLNDGNRIGQMNDMIARSRQLVFSSRQNNDLAVANCGKDLQQLSSQLLEEDRQNAVNLDKERNKLQAIAVKEATLSMKNEFAKQSSLYKMVLPWLVVKSPQLTNYKFGCINSISSNVYLPTGMETLSDFDLTKRVADRKTKLYLSNVNAKLPDDDSDLNFYLSSIAAPVGKTIAPARLVQGNAFSPVIGPFLPSATSITVRIGMASDFKQDATTDVSVTSTAATSGASPTH